MLNRMQVTALVFAGLFGLCAMIGLVYFLAYLVETKQFEWAEFWATVAVIALVFIWLFAPGKLDEERQEAQRLKEEQSYRDYVARKREVHIAEKQSKPTIEDQYANFVDKWGKAQQAMCMPETTQTDKAIESQRKHRKEIKTYNFINDLN